MRRKMVVYILKKIITQMAKSSLYKTAWECAFRNQKWFSDILPDTKYVSCLFFKALFVLKECVEIVFDWTYFYSAENKHLNSDD